MDCPQLFRITLIGLAIGSCLSRTSFSQDDSHSKLERWDRAVCLATEKTGPDKKKTANSGTGFLVVVGKQLYLVTARHVAEPTFGKTRMLFRTPDGDSRWILLGGFLSKAGNPWTHHPNADLSIMPLSESKVSEKERKWLHTLAIPLENIRSEMPKRTTQIDVTGFPVMLGVRPEISPLVMVSHLASKQTKTQGKWGLEDVVYTFPVVGDGTSGGPVFLSKSDSQEAIVVGVYYGYILDKSGPKVAKIVPGNVLFDFIKSQKPKAADESKPQPKAVEAAQPNVK